MIKKHFWILISFLALNALLALFIVQERNYVNQAKDIAVQFKANFLKDSVTNFIHEFERNREDSIENFDFAVSERENNLAQTLAYAYSVNAVQSIVDRTFTSNDARGMWGYALVVGLDEQIALSQNVPDDWDKTTRTLDGIFCAWREVENPVGRFYFGITQEHLYNTMVSIVRSKVYDSHFVEETYYWVNQVLNYKGGKDYAVRLIHPNPRSSEGMMLSTDMQDAIGDRPYETELEGINKDGEVLSSYYFKKKDSDNFARKITYAKLYKPYNWIVCMGSYYDDIYDYVDTMNKVRGKSMMRIALPLVIILDLLAAFFIVRLFYTERKENNEAKRQLNRDQLTDADSRASGERELKKKFNEFKSTKESPAIMIMDVDNFKTINDSFGRETGDFVLIQIVNIFYEQSRVSDILIRWEGDQFVAIFNGMQKSVCWTYAQKLLEAISQKNIQYKERHVQATVSLGFSFFNEGDKTHLQVLERAQNAMLEAKGAGKNRARVD